MARRAQVVMMFGDRFCVEWADQVKLTPRTKLLSGFTYPRAIRTELSPAGARGVRREAQTAFVNSFRPPAETGSFPWGR